jgi:hypothetical protein
MSDPPAIVCERCRGPLVRGQHVGPLFAAKLVKWAEHPVLSKPIVLRGTIPAVGGHGKTRLDLSMGAQLRQRAAMGGAKEQAELAAFDELWRKIAEAIVAPVRKEAAEHNVGVMTWLARNPPLEEE